MKTYLAITLAFFQIYGICQEQNLHEDPPDWLYTPPPETLGSGTDCAWNGSNLRLHQPPSQESAIFWKIWGSDTDDVYVVGGNINLPGLGLVVHYDGDNWTQVQGGWPENVLMRGIWGNSANDVFAVGETTTQGIILHFDGSDWTETRTSTAYLSSVWGSSPTNVFATGDGVILFYDGTQWSEAFSAPFLFQDVFGFSNNDVYAVGYSGSNDVVFHYNGASWSEVSTPISANFLNSVWGSGPNDVYVAGTGGRIYRYNGAGWSQSGSQVEPIYDLWGCGLNRVYAATSQPSGYTLYYYDGSVWFPVSIGSSSGFTGVWGAPDKPDFFSLRQLGNTPLVFRIGPCVAPAITAQPEGVTVCLGERVSFAIAVTGTERDYQWRLNGSNIPGATERIYTIPSTASGDVGTYDCVVENECGQQLSDGVILTFKDELVFTTQPSNQMSCPGGTATFTSQAAGTGSPSYQWYKDDVLVPGETAPSLVIEGLSFADEGNYSCQATDLCTSRFSMDAQLTIEFNVFRLELVEQWLSTVEDPCDDANGDGLLNIFDFIALLNED